MCYEEINDVGMFQWCEVKKKMKVAVLCMKRVIFVHSVLLIFLERAVSAETKLLVLMNLDRDQSMSLGGGSEWKNLLNLRDIQSDEYSMVLSVS